MTADQRFLDVLHWNIHSWIDPATRASNAPVLVDLIDRRRPDVVTLVEVDEPYGTRGPLREVAQACGYVAVHAPTFTYGEPSGPRGTFGNAILTRLPVLGVAQHQLTWPDTVYENIESSEPRTLLLVEVAGPGGHLTIGVTHLPHEDPHARDQALQRLRGIVSSTNEPWVVLGDFNTEPSAWIPGHQYRTSELPTGPTYPSHDPRALIDYAVASTNVTVRSQTLEQPGSDHLPVLTRLTVDLR